MNDALIQWLEEKPNRTIQHDAGKNDYTLREEQNGVWQIVAKASDTYALYVDLVGPVKRPLCDSCGLQTGTIHFGTFNVCPSCKK